MPRATIIKQVIGAKSPPLRSDEVYSIYGDRIPLTKAVDVSYITELNYKVNKSFETKEGKYYAHISQVFKLFDGQYVLEDHRNLGYEKLSKDATGFVASNEIVFSHLFHDFVEVILAPGADKIWVKNTAEFQKLNFVESFSLGAFVPPIFESAAFKKYSRFEPFASQFLQRYASKVKTNSILENKNYSFGVEIECNDLYIPRRFRKLLNIHCERDGSINRDRSPHGGPEIVTGVLKGDAGFLDLQNICREVGKRSKISKDCGIHVHIGGDIVFNTEFIVYSYLLGLKLENEIFNIMPQSRRNNQYCALLPPIKTICADLHKAMHNDFMAYSNLLENAKDNIYNLALKDIPDKDKDLYKTKEKNHPKGARCGYDRSSIRYCWLNFIPVIFNTRGNGVHTIEFRNHSASANFVKISNWILICAAFVNYVENYKENILRENVTLEDIILKAYPRKAKKLISYINDRRETFNGNSSATAESKEYSKVNNFNKKLKKHKDLCV